MLVHFFIVYSIFSERSSSYYYAARLNKKIYIFCFVNHLPSCKCLHEMATPKVLIKDPIHEFLYIGIYFFPRRIGAYLFLNKMYKIEKKKRKTKTCMN